MLLQRNVIQYCGPIRDRPIRDKILFSKKILGTNKGQMSRNFFSISQSTRLGMRSDKWLSTRSNKWLAITFRFSPAPKVFLYSVPGSLLCPLFPRSNVRGRREGTPVPMGTRVSAGTHRNFENFWVPMGTGY